ncbi:hypothetical protein IJ579_02845 [bacterium]|nr:hypothetical protein [bacterium]
MSKDRFKNSIWFTLADGIRIYFSNIDKFFLYMLFPVFGQLIGITLSFGLTLGLADKIAQKSTGISSALLLIFLLALPGLLIFMKAFWDYMVAYVALNSMTEGALTTGKVYDFQSHRQVATRRSFKFIGLLLVIGILTAIGSSIFFIIPAFILWIYLILIFQVFTFEADLTIKECFKRSFSLIKGDWLRTCILMLILGFFSIFLITEGVTVIFDYLNLTEPVCHLFDFISNKIPLDFVNKVLVYIKMDIITPDKISGWIFYTILSFIVAGLTLPIRSICWTLWYETLSELKTEKNSNKREK